MQATFAEPESDARHVVIEMICLGRPVALRELVSAGLDVGAAEHANGQIESLDVSCNHLETLGGMMCVCRTNTTRISILAPVVPAFPRATPHGLSHTKVSWLPPIIVVLLDEGLKNQ